MRAMAPTLMSWSRMLPRSFISRILDMMIQKLMNMRTPVKTLTERVSRITL